MFEKEIEELFKLSMRVVNETRTIVSGWLRCRLMNG